MILTILLSLLSASTLCVGLFVTWKIIERNKEMPERSHILIFALCVGCEPPPVERVQSIWPDVEVRILLVAPVDVWGGPKALSTVELPDGRRAEFGYALGKPGEILKMSSWEVDRRLISGFKSGPPEKLTSRNHGNIHGQHEEV